MPFATPDRLDMHAFFSIDELDAMDFSIVKSLCGRRTSGWELNRFLLALDITSPYVSITASERAVLFTDMLVPIMLRDTTTYTQHSLLAPHLFDNAHYSPGHHHSYLLAKQVHIMLEGGLDERWVYLEAFSRFTLTPHYVCDRLLTMFHHLQTPLLLLEVLERRRRHVHGCNAASVSLLLKTMRVFAELGALARWDVSLQSRLISTVLHFSGHGWEKMPHATRCLGGREWGNYEHIHDQACRIVKRIHTDLSTFGCNPPQPLKSVIARATVKSSWGQSFLAVSMLPFASGVDPPSSVDSAQLIASATRIVDYWKRQNAIILTDFEGEMPGWGGELTVAQFLPTAAINADLDPMHLEGEPRNDVNLWGYGLLVDMRTPETMALVRRIMQSRSLTKLIWGCDGDLTSLRFQRSLPGGKTVGRNVIDIQLAYSELPCRLGMATMLTRVPLSIQEGLPRKGQNDYSPHAMNKRVWHFPMLPELQLYAMDDLHRIECILRSQTPQEGSYYGAKRQTTQWLIELPKPSCAVEWIMRALSYRARNGMHDDARHQQKAVNIARAVIHIKCVHGVALAARDQPSLNDILEKMQHDCGFEIPSDLSFGVSQEKEELLALGLHSEAEGRTAVILGLPFKRFL